MRFSENLTEYPVLGYSLLLLWFLYFVLLFLLLRLEKRKNKSIKELEKQLESKDKELSDEKCNNGHWKSVAEDRAKALEISTLTNVQINGEKRALSEELELLKNPPAKPRHTHRVGGKFAKKESSP